MKLNPLAKVLKKVHTIGLADILPTAIGKRAKRTMTTAPISSLAKLM
jgi:hypothetical protein